MNRFDNNTLNIDIMSMTLNILCHLIANTHIRNLPINYIQQNPGPFGG